MEEGEGLIFRRHRDWIEKEISARFGNEKTFSLDDGKLTEILLSKYDYLDSCISNEDFGSSLNNHLALLLKFILEHGPYLDSNMNYREQIDMFFTMFRNLLRNHLKNLPHSINLLLLRLIEIRACRWKIKSSIEEYYMKKINKTDVLPDGPQTFHYCPKNFEPLETGVVKFSSTGIRASKSYGDIITDYKSDDAMFGRHKKLNPNSKAVIKDEVVIKNSDSGKVMGIKGRRVHMIEEMSDTIISFQKVSSNAKDRLVQISGQTKESINIAKNIIDATIRQNVSPIPFNENMESSAGSCQMNEEYNSSHHEAVTACAKYSSQSSSNSLSENEPSGHSIKLNANGKDASICVSDKRIGEQLEKFLQKFNFVEFLRRKCSEDSIRHSNDVSKSNLNNAGDDAPHYYKYDRDFLLQFKNLMTQPTRIIKDIKSKQEHLYRDKI